MNLNSAHAKPFSRKTQLAIEFAHRILDSSNDTWIFWVHAATVLNVIESYSTIGKAIGRVCSGGSSFEMMRSVHDWLDNEHNGKWIMIIDNADDFEVWTTVLRPTDNNMETSAQPITTSLDAQSPMRLDMFLPNSRNGHILITSRYREVGRLLTGDYPQVLQLEEMNEVEAIDLFVKRSGMNHDPLEVANLVRKLDYIPLAVSHAASYIVSRAGRVTISQYLNDIGETGQKALQALKPASNGCKTQWEKPTSVATTLMISFEYIEHTVPSAARLLAFMSLFDRQNIPEELLIGNYSQETAPIVRRQKWWKKYREKHRKNKEVPIVIDCDFDRDHRMLSDFGLVKTEQDGKHFKMHRLVQSITQRWLESQQKLLYWQTRYVELMYAKYPWPEDTTYKKCEELFTHAQMARSYRPSDAKLLENWGFLMHNAAAYAHPRGLFQEALELNAAAVSAWEIVFGKTHSNTLRVMNNMAHMLRSMQKDSEAEQLFRKVLTVREQTLGQSHVDTLRTAHSLARLLTSLQKYDEAEILHKRALAGFETILGMEDLETKLAASSLSHLLHLTGREDERWEVFRRAFPGNPNDVYDTETDEET